MINLKKILNEDVGSIWSPRQYQASSMAPRKDQGLIFILEAAKKISICGKINKSLTKKQKNDLVQVYKKLIVISKEIEKVGINLPNIINMSSETTDQIPPQPFQSPYIPSTVPMSNQQTSNLQSQKL